MHLFCLSEIGVTCCCTLVAIIMADPESSGKMVLVCWGTGAVRFTQFCEAPSGGGYSPRF